MPPPPNSTCLHVPVAVVLWRDAQAFDQPTLQRFNNAKENLTKAVGRLLSTLEQTVTCMVPTTWVDSSLAGPAVVHEDSLKDEIETVKGVITKVKGVHEAVQRDAMKVVFVGRTSTGKSTTINAMLHSKILPSGIGHTTNCFCRVHGVAESQPYLITAASQERQSIESVKQLAHALYPDEHLGLQRYARQTAAVLVLVAGDRPQLLCALLPLSLAAHAWPVTCWFRCHIVPLVLTRATWAVF